MADTIIPPGVTSFSDGKASQVPAEQTKPEAQSQFDDNELLDLFKQIKKECIDPRWVFERQWHRNILYVLGRQWIEYVSRQGGWRDKRIAQWIPRPVTNKCKETVQAIRAMFTAVHIGVNVRPNGTDPKNASTAAVADEISPLVHDSHHMNARMTEFDFWLITTGNAFLHTFVDYDIKHGTFEVATEMCQDCRAEYTSDKFVDGCPDCGSKNIAPAMEEDGVTPKVERRPIGRPATIALSPLEVAFPNSYARFDDLPYIVRLRWRPKSYYENHPQLKKLVPEINWATAPADQSLMLFKSLANHNDLGIAPIYWTEGQTTGNSEEGISEYEVWMKPCDAYPDGLVFRVIGDQNPKVIHLEETEAIPGPMPYTDIEKKPLFPFAHAGYEHVGGRVLASGPLDVIIQKQDQLNQLDSLIMLIIMRMANPVWLEPKGAEIQRLTGMPGLVVKWNPLTVGGNAKPERIPGENVPASLFQLREQLLKDIEELAGTFDIIKGAKPTGVEAFSALQLLVERSQSRFSNTFGARGDAYRAWYQTALELERQFGPNEYIKYSLTDARQWTYQTFQRAQLQGSVTVIVEDGSTAPKTSLGMRAAVQQAQAMQMLNMQDPDVVYEGLKLFGLQKMVPSIDINVQSALQKQQAFEEWTQDPKKQKQSQMMWQQKKGEYDQEVASLSPAALAQGIKPQPPPLTFGTPLAMKKWYNPRIHRQEFLKWANSDRIRLLLQTQPNLEGFLDAHLDELNMAVAQEMAMMNPTQMSVASPSGAALSMTNSNRESTQGVMPKGNGEGAQNAGPA